MYSGLDSFFDDFFGNNYSQPVRRKIPKVSIFEDSKGYTFEVAVPGYQMEDLQVKVEKKVLTIATSDAYNKRLAEKDSSSDTPAENEKPAKPLSSYREFRKDATFSRSFQLPKYVDISSIKAQLSKGILSIRIQKAEDAQPQLIEIA